MMDELWGSGDPNQSLTDLYFAAYDDHRYIKYDTSVTVSKDSYISTSCNDNLDSNTPTIIGEFCLSPPDDVQWDSDWAPDSNKDFYKQWFAAQVQAYEKQQGWIFWTWKSQLGDYRWSYSGTSTSTLEMPAIWQCFCNLADTRSRCCRSGRYPHEPGRRI
jgi:hypothetical protein